MKRYLLINFLICVLSANAKISFVKIEQKTYPSLCNKNFLLISGEREIWRNRHRSYDGTTELILFERNILPELFRDYVDRFYTFKTRTVLFLEPRTHFPANLLSVHGDTLFFQFLKAWYKEGRFDFELTEKINQFKLLDYGIRYKSEIEKVQTLNHYSNPNTNEKDSMLSLSSTQILKVLQDSNSAGRLDLFLNNTKKYYYRDLKLHSVKSCFINNPYISCYYQNDSYNFLNQKTHRVFLTLKKKEIKQFTGCGTTNYLINIEKGPIYHYNALTDSLTVFMKADYFDKFIHIDSNEIDDPFVILGRYPDPSGRNNTENLQKNFLLGSVSAFDREYVYQDSNKLPVFTGIHYYPDPYEMKRVIKNKTYPIWFVYFSLFFIATIVFLFLKINLQKKK